MGDSDILNLLVRLMPQGQYTIKNLRSLNALVQSWLAEKDPDRLFEDTGLERADMLAYLKGSLALSRCEREDQVVQVFASQIPALLRMQAFFLLSWERMSDRLLVWKSKIAVGPPAGPAGEQPIALSGFPLARKVLEDGLVVQERFDRKPAGAGQEDRGQEPGIKSLLMLPVAAQEEVIGLILAFDPRLVVPVGDHRLALAQAFAQQAAQAILQFRRSQAALQRIDDLEAICRATLNLAAGLDLQEVLDAALVSVFNLMKGARYAYIFLIEEDELVLGAGLREDGKNIRAGARLKPDNLTHRVARQGQGFVKTYSPVQTLRASRSRRPQGAIAALPLKAGGRVVGVMTVAHPGPQAFSTSNLRTLQIFGDQAAVAIENARLHDLVSRKAFTDALTGLPNRSALDARLAEETRRSSRYKHPLALIMIDIDALKQINDTYGRSSGDRVLRQIAICLRGQLRDSDFLARYSGDEFTVLLPETELSGARGLVERLTKAAADCSLEIPDLEKRKDYQGVTVTAGLAEYPSNGSSAASLLHAAQQALEQAKQSMRQP